jgi:type IV secretion system protein VirD4
MNDDAWLARNREGTHGHVVAPSHGAVVHPGIVLGCGADGWAWSGGERSALVLGPTRSGKSTSIIIPNLLCAPHSVVATSTKDDLLVATGQARRRCGSVLLFDPVGEVDAPPGVVRVGWTPLQAARRWDGAQATASAMVAAARRRALAEGPTDHWAERAGSLLGTLLHAAALSEAPMADVLRWTDRHRGEDALERLEGAVGAEHPATSLLAGILDTDQREQSGIWSTASGVLGAYRSSAVLESSALPELDAGAFVDGAHSLFICSSARRQAQLVPLVVGLLGEVQAAAYERNDPARPVLFALDELANIAPLPELPQLVSEGGGQGLLTIGCLQDLSQARQRWGALADGFLSIFPTTVVLGGVADTRTLAMLRDLAGEHDVPSYSTSSSGGRRRATSWSETVGSVRRPRLGIDEAARGRPGHALVLGSDNELGWVRLTRSYRDEPWRSLISRDGPERSR